MNNYKPELGEECEFRTEARNEWDRITPEYIGERFFVFHNNGTEMVIEHKWAEFRPIRTQEEIEREEAIEDIARSLVLHDLFSKRNQAEEIISLGYQKVGEKVDAPELRRKFNCVRNPASNGMTLGDANWLLANYDIYRKVEK